MNKITLRRKVITDKSTIGELDVFGYNVITLEDTKRQHKVWGETRIPAGTYKLQLRAAGGMHERYKAKYGSKHHGMLHLKEVPFFEWVYIHIGNTPEDTEGCILVGKQAGEDQIYSSRDAYWAIYPSIQEAIQDGGCWIEVLDEEPQGT